MSTSSTIKGPGIAVAQYISDEAPFNTLEGIVQWAAKLGYKGLQIPVDERMIDIQRAAESQDYCDSILAIFQSQGVQLTELASHLQGQLVAVHPAYDALCDTLAPPHVRGSPRARTEWARLVLLQCAAASKRLGLKAHATFSGSLAWPYVHPWPQRPADLVETAFAELGDRWNPILDAFDQADVDVCFELHPTEDLHDGVSFDRFLTTVDFHPRACILYDPSHGILQCLDYLAFIDIYHERIKSVHMEDAELVPDGRQGGIWWVDFKAIVTRLTRYGFDGWLNLENECPFRDPLVCAAEGKAFLDKCMIPPALRAFDDYAGGEVDQHALEKMMGL
ncbi:xylose isomerase domain-containing protein [Aspergillus ellipticus CBS 707.79]|uniref:Xylose isomerase domain-containing protein n=1 Tax=Aspergillus ellipticus CBS 707.79 TaxID=1448320 RepID=A0A319EF30_9EURO|nr:xylose isomerase domain-containing protein [Aspergillus ellipticus CBS 707.79]